MVWVVCVSVASVLRAVVGVWPWVGGWWWWCVDVGEWVVGGCVGVEWSGL